MNKQNELIEILKTHPDRELIFLDSEYRSHTPYTMGRINEILIDEYWIDGERIWLKDEDRNELHHQYSNIVFDELYAGEEFIVGEQINIINQKTKEYLDSQEWKKCICVYISY